MPPATSPTAFTHDSSNCHDLTGIPGQRNPDPPGGFYNHFIVRIDGKFLDPSYGAGPFTTHAAWEAAAIDGLFRTASPSYGFHGGATTLLEFRDATTQALI